MCFLGANLRSGNRFNLIGCIKLIFLAVQQRAECSLAYTG